MRSLYSCNGSWNRCRCAEVTSARDKSRWNGVSSDYVLASGPATMLAVLKVPVRFEYSPIWEFQNGSCRDDVPIFVYNDWCVRGFADGHWGWGMAMCDIGGATIAWSWLGTYSSTNTIAYLGSILFTEWRFLNLGWKRHGGCGYWVRKWFLSWVGERVGYRGGGGGGTGIGSPPIREICRA